MKSFSFISWAKVEDFRLGENKLGHRSEGKLMCNNRSCEFFLGVTYG